MTDVMTPRHKTGRCLTGYERDGGTLAHAVFGEHSANSYVKAACGTRPGLRGNGWATWPSEQVTCPRCVARLEKMKEGK